MKQSTLMTTMLGAWALALIYNRIETNTGVEVKLLLCASIAAMVVGLYLFCRKPRETYEERGQ